MLKRDIPKRRLPYTLSRVRWIKHYTNHHGKIFTRYTSSSRGITINRLTHRVVLLDILKTGSRVI